MELNAIVLLLNLIIFWILGESAEGFFKKEIERSVSFLLTILIIIYSVDMMMLLSINYLFNWYSSPVLLLKEQSVFYLILSSVVLVSYYLKGKIKRFS
ncbi:MAG TPA: hypothetical protein DEP48_07950 [Persephonella sp.]|uniref:Uncharacterized protein n=1 Tax=Persephonella marina (strain DSM 14350 / EX-H1) TaxID=123214 RepID=C0QTU1_PERMH|nr:MULTISPECIES: hypothetical protein [Persephonella]ACO03487.1 conserved hypothetical protein [Persephonella marina EX-H1]HCB70276.1 hypothetical protein [Persephonella sp.]